MFHLISLLLPSINSDYSLEVYIRLRTNQNLATELDLAIVAKRSFKIVYISYIYHNKKTH